jgi:hypothetical protein
MSREGLVYFLRCGEFCKIGFSDQPEARKRELEVGNPNEVVLIGCWGGTMQDERRVHRYFASSHHRGEWFHWCPDIERVAKAGLPRLIHDSRGDLRLAPLARTAASPPSPFGIRRRLQRAVEKLPAVAAAALRPIHVVRTGIHRLLKRLPIEVADEESPESLMNTVSPTHDLCKFINSVDMDDPADLAYRAGITGRQAANAIKGRPLATVPYLRASIAVGYDPLPELAHNKHIIPGDFEFLVFAVAFRLTRRLSGHSLRDCAALLNVSATTLCRLEAGDPMFIGVVLRACRYIGVHPFGYVSVSVIHETIRA